MEQRRAYEDRDPASARAGDEQNGMPPALTRRYELLVEPPAKMANKPLAVRAVKASKIGQLVTVRGIVTRVTDVKPMITVVRAQAAAAAACSARARPRREEQSERRPGGAKEEARPGRVGGASRLPPPAQRGDAWRAPWHDAPPPPRLRTVGRPRTHASSAGTRATSRW